MLRQQRALSAFLALNKALHVAPVVMRYCLNVYRYGFVYTALRFYTGWTQSRHLVSDKPTAAATITKNLKLSRTMVCPNAKAQGRGGFGASAEAPGWESRDQLSRLRNIDRPSTGDCPLRRAKIRYISN